MKKFRSGPGIRFIVALACLPAALPGQTPPAGLARSVAERERANQRERDDYTYRQTVVVEELDSRGIRAGEYREVRDIIFSPGRERVERIIEGPSSSLRRLGMTPEDFRDIREVQPFLFTPDQLWIYETRLRGEERIEDEDCWLLQVRPRQILEGQRLFDGLFWVSKKDFSIVRSEGKAVPEIHRTKAENLFPRFTTLRAPVDGKHWFPVRTVADDILPFRTGPLRMRLTIRYSNYQRFTADSTVRYDSVSRP